MLIKEMKLRYVQETRCTADDLEGKAEQSGVEVETVETVETKAVLATEVDVTLMAATAHHRFRL